MNILTHTNEPRPLLVNPAMLKSLPWEAAPNKDSEDLVLLRPTFWRIQYPTRYHDILPWSDECS